MVSVAQNNLVQSYLRVPTLLAAIATDVADKAFNADQPTGASIQDLPDSLASEASDNSLAGDALLAQATGLGGQLDVLA